MSKPKFLVRLRVENDEIVDLAGNTVVPSDSISISDVGLVGNKCISVNSLDTGYISFPEGFYETLDDEDFTVSAWVDISGVREVYSVWTGLFASQQRIGVAAPKAVNFGLFSHPGGVLGFYYNPTASDIQSPTAFFSSAVCYNKGKCHVAWCRKGNALFIFFNGQNVLYESNAFNNVSFDVKMPVGMFQDPAFFNYGYSGMIGLVDDACIIKGRALWTKDFTPPNGYLSLYDVIYLTGSKVYGVSGEGFEKLEDYYTTLTDAQKIEMYDNIRDDATVEDLYTIEMPINLEICIEQANGKSCILYGIPDEQLIIPDTLTNINKKLRFVAILGSGDIRVAITKDGNIYYVYNFMTKEWETIDIDEISTRGMSIGEVQAITAEMWEEYNPSQLGFAFYMEADSADEVVEVNKVVINYTGGEQNG